MKGVKTMTESKKNKNAKDEIVYEVERHCIGNVTPIQAILPVIMDDIKRKREKYIEEQKKKNKNVEN